jgi:maltose O-acetyltransferase
MPTEKEKMRAGERYDPRDPELRAERRRARRLTDAYNATALDDPERRRELRFELFGSVGADAVVEPPFRCDYGANISVGDDFFANYDCVVLDVCPVDIGDRCLLGPSVHLYTATHSLSPAERRRGLEYGQPVTVGDDVWIGGQAVLTPGVTVGEAAVVGAGAVVTDDVPARTVVQGNPATVVREIE